MIVRRNERLVRRRRRQAGLLSVIGIVVLAVGLALNFKGATGTALAALVAGSVASWFGIALTERWLRPPLPDDVLARGLGRAGRAFRLYHWLLPADHVLLSPWGLTVFLPVRSEGAIEIRDGTWRERTPLLKRMLALGRQPLGRPVERAEEARERLADAIAPHLPSGTPPEVGAVALFTQPEVRIEGADPRLPAVRGDELASWLQEARKAPRLSNQDRRALEKALDAVAGPEAG